MSLTLIWPFNVIQGQILSGKLKGHIWLTIFISYKLLIIRCTVSEILAEIDYKGPNWTFRTLKMTFRVIPYLYLTTWLDSQQRRYLMQSIWAALRYYWIISIIMGKWAKPDFSDLENDLLYNSMKSISWQLINIIPKKLHARNKEKLSDHFWENWQKVAKTTKFDLYRTFWTLKNYL